MDTIVISYDITTAVDLAERLSHHAQAERELARGSVLQAWKFHHATRAKAFKDAAEIIRQALVH